MKRFLTVFTSSALLLTGAVDANAAPPPVAEDAGPVIQNIQVMAAADQAAHPLNMRQQIENPLSKDGYSTITVMPSSFFVPAKDKAGNPVAMVIGPDSFTEVMDVPSKKAANQAPAHKAGGTDNPTPVAAQK